MSLVDIYRDKDLKTALKNIRCPLHYVKKPKCNGFMIEPNPLAKNFTDDMCKKFGLKKWKYKRDRYGNKYKTLMIITNQRYQHFIAERECSQLDTLFVLSVDAVFNRRQNA